MATTNKNLNTPANNSSNWDVPLNANFNEIDAAFGGVQTINLTSYAGTPSPIVLTNTFPIVTSPLTSLSYLPLIINLTGSPLVAATIQIPSGVGGQWIVVNGCSGTYSAVTFTSGGGGTSVSISAGQTRMIYSDGINISFSDDQTSIPSGTAMLFAQATAPTGWTKSTANNDKALRVVSGGSGGTAGGSTAFSSVFTSRTITTANMPSHTHGVSDPGHNHVVSYPAAGAIGVGPTFTAGGAQGNTFSQTTTTSTTGISIQATGSGTPMDFAVQYLDVIVCTKN